MLWIKVIMVLFSLTGIYSVKVQINDVNTGKQIIIAILLQFWTCFAFVCVWNLTASDLKNLWEGDTTADRNREAKATGALLLSKRLQEPRLKCRGERLGKPSEILCPSFIKQHHRARVNQEGANQHASKKTDSFSLIFQIKCMFSIFKIWKYAQNTITWLSVGCNINDYEQDYTWCLISSFSMTRYLFFQTSKLCRLFGANNSIKSLPSCISSGLWSLWDTTELLNLSFFLKPSVNWNTDFCEISSK